MNRLLILLLLGVSLALSACQKKEDETAPKMSSEEVKKEVKEAAVAVGEHVNQERNEFVDKVQKEMDELNNKLAELKKQALEATGEAKTKLDQQIQNLEQELKAAEQKLADLKSATGDKWNELKAGVSDAVEHLKQSFQKAKEG